MEGKGGRINGPGLPVSATATHVSSRVYFLQRSSTLDRVKEATKGYYSDFSATKKHGGKTWVAPTTLIKEDVSLQARSQRIDIID